MAQTYSEQLDSVQTLIAAIESRGQATSVNGRTLTRADLGTLYEREKYLRRMVDRQARGGIRIRQAVPLDG